MLGPAAMLTMAGLLLAPGLEAKPITSGNRVGAFYYLVNYGYIAKDESKETAALMSDEVITHAVTDFQVLTKISRCEAKFLNDEGVCWIGTYRCTR